MCSLLPRKLTKKATLLLIPRLYSLESVFQPETTFSLPKTQFIMTLTTQDLQKKRVQVDDYTRGMIIGRFQGGQSPSDIHRHMEIPESTVVDCINHWKKTSIENHIKAIKEASQTL